MVAGHNGEEAAMASTAAKLRGALPVAGGDPLLEEDAAAVHRALNELVRVYQFRDRDRICCYDVSVTQCYALEAVVMDGPLTLNELAARLYLDKSTASRVVDGLERKALVERRPSPEDRRALHLRPTAEGRRLHARIEADILAQERALLAEFPHEVRQSMARLMGQLARAAGMRIDTAGGSCCTVG
jgi:MarR family transcriptional regulator, 2-MHQ and catechol-resistance regulon repressor